MEPMAADLVAGIPLADVSPWALVAMFVVLVATGRLVPRRTYDDKSHEADEWRAEFRSMRASGIHGIIPEIYNGRQTFFQSRRLPVRAAWLEGVIPIAAAAGLEVHGWMWCMPCLIDAVISTHPDWYNVNAKGESAVDKPAYVDYYKFLDPARPEVREFVRDTVRELAAIPGLTGVHLDYIRHPDAILPSGLWSKYGIVQDKVYPPYDYGYTEYSRRVFKAKTGVDPIELKDPETHAAWMQYRLDSVVDLVNDYLVRDLKQRGLWDEVMIADVKYFDGNLARIDRVPGDLRRLYATAFEIEPKWLVECAARRQKWIDQSQSLNIYMAGASGKKLDDTYKLAWIRGLKTTYYLRAMGATHAEKSTTKTGQLNAVPAAEEAKVCSIENPDCEACQ